MHYTGCRRCGDDGRNRRDRRGAAAAELVRQPLSLMPSDVAGAFSAEELVDLVAWLETLRQTN
jgi:hypothetical protein